MDEQFVSYDIALALKELGFDEPCFGWYYNNGLELDINANETVDRNQKLGRFKDCFIAPLYQQVFKFFRDKYNIDVVIGSSYDRGKTYFFRIETSPTLGYQYFDDKFNTYEEAEIAYIIKLIEILKNK